MEKWTSSNGSGSGGLGSRFKDKWLSRIECDLKEAHKNNDFIYHARIPDEKSLAPIARVLMAKPTPLPPHRLGDTSIPLLFETTLASS